MSLSRHPHVGLFRGFTSFAVCIGLVVAGWFCANRLTLNFEKTNFTIFKSHRKSMPLANQMSLVINGVPITQVITTKFLGVYVDQHLTWKEHIKKYIK